MGIYVHIPFCRSKCYYCGFYSVASVQLKDDYIASLCKEIEWRKADWGNAPVRSLYLGGGTPSFLSLDDLSCIVRQLEAHFWWDESAERTLEMNPEDANTEKIRELRQLGFNRLSIGIQSFNSNVLKQMNRSHTVNQAIYAVEEAHRCGFENISIDLIIGMPGRSVDEYMREFKLVERLPVSHISVYMLSIDPGSVFEQQMKKGRFSPEEEDQVAETYIRVSDYFESVGFDHYEISNFAKDFTYSKHNTSYWQQCHYMGFGAAAHSYNGCSRQWNVAHIKKYIDGLNKGVLDFEKEDLTEKDKFNEYIMTRLRTKWGICIAQMKKQFPDYSEDIIKKIKPYLNQKKMILDKGRFSLTKEGWLVSDGIFSDLFIDG